MIRKRAANEEPAELDGLTARKRCQQLSADQITAENKEKIHTNPAETIRATGQLESEKRSVINNDDDDCQCPEKIETRLALSVLKPRVEINLKLCCRFARHAKKKE